MGKAVKESDIRVAYTPDLYMWKQKADFTDYSPYSTINAGLATTATGTNYYNLKDLKS